MHEATLGRKRSRWKRLMLIFKLGRKKGGSDKDEAAGPALLPPPVSPGAELVTTPMGSPVGSPARSAVASSPPGISSPVLGAPAAEDDAYEYSYYSSSAAGDAPEAAAPAPPLAITDTSTAQTTAIRVLR